MACDIPHRGFTRAGVGSRMALKTFTDSRGQQWRVWNVERVPLTGRPDYLEREYQNGWLVFERIGSDERRRLGDYPADWDQLSDDSLGGLCQRAKSVTRPGSREGSLHDDPGTRPR